MEVLVCRCSFGVCCCVMFCYWPKLEQIHPRSSQSGGAIMMIAHVRAARGQGLSFHSPTDTPQTHTSNETHTHICLYPFSGYIIWTDRHTHTWNPKLFLLSICRGYLYDTSSHPCLYLISSHHTHLCTLVGQLSGAFKGIRLSSMEDFDLWVTEADAFRHRQMRRTVCAGTSNSRGDVSRVQAQETEFKKSWLEVILIKFWRAPISWNSTLWKRI